MVKFMDVHAISLYIQQNMWHVSCKGGNVEYYEIIIRNVKMLKYDIYWQGEYHGKPYWMGILSVWEKLWYQRT